MFCLFRSSRIIPRLDRFVVLFSWIFVAYWLHFAFIQKSLLSKLFAGQALIVDLVVGLPLVLAMAVMVYATIYWSIKIVFIFLLPQFVIQVEEPVEQEDLTDLEQQHGEQYWQNNKQQPDSEGKDLSDKDPNNKTF